MSKFDFLMKNPEVKKKQKSIKNHRSPNQPSKGHTNTNIFSHLNLNNQQPKNKTKQKNNPISLN